MRVSWWRLLPGDGAAGENDQTKRRPIAASLALTRTTKKVFDLSTQHDLGERNVTRYMNVSRLDLT